MPVAVPAKYITFESDMWSVAARETVFMTPSAFLMLVPEVGILGSVVAEIQSSLVLGTTKTLTTPYLQLLFPASKGAHRVVDTQEGRHRTRAIMNSYGDVEVPVELVYGGDLRGTTLVSKRDGGVIGDAFKRAVPPMKRSTLKTVAVVPLALAVPVRKD